MRKVVLVFLLFGVIAAYESPKELTLNLITAYPPSFIDENSEPQIVFEAILGASYKFALDLIRNQSCSFLPVVLENTEIKLNEVYHYQTAANSIAQMINIADQGASLVIGLSDNTVAIPAGTVSTVYDVAILSGNGNSAQLDDNLRYPYFTRMVFSNSKEVITLHDQLVMFYEEYGIGWSNIATISSINEHTLEYTKGFITVTQRENILKIAAFQQVLADQEDVELELQEVKDSGARVIVTSIADNLMNVLEQAFAMGLVDEHHVWATDTIVHTQLYPSDLVRGMLTTQFRYAQGGPNEQCYRDAYANVDPSVYFGAGGPLPYGFVFDNPFDTVMTSLIAADALDKMELLDRRVPAELWTQAIRNVSYDSLKAHISFTPDGDRVNPIEVAYADLEAFARGEPLFIPFAVVDEGTYTKIADVIWYSNTTEIPDLDIRPAFSYWSCKDGEEGYDETGKRITLHSPDGSNIDEIDIDYHCDAFIDCKNLSDERYDCESNYVIVFIVFGIITILLMLVVLLLIIFVLIFGSILKYQRVKARSPIFLLILLASIFIGYASIFAWYGKPHPVACGFQPWLLGLPTVSMVAVLSAKNYRVWRIFSSPLRRVHLTDIRLLLLWAGAMIPALFIIILWTIISTPSADFVEIGDSEHYVCVTGGFTGYPGGYIFFSIFVAYVALVLGVGGIISILARNIHPMFNESKLLTISIYNLALLGVVIIPVFLVVQPFNPFIAWILRTIAILYAFTATMVIQFMPIVFGVVVTDKFKPVEHKLTTAPTASTSNSTFNSQN